MLVVTVEEAAHRLGVSVATVRRRLSAGSLAGKKVGRDWQVEEACLPPAAIGRPSGTASSTFTDDEIRRAIKHVSGTDTTELWIPDVLRWADFFADGEALLTRTRRRLNSGVIGPALEVRVPKNSLATRAGTMIDLEDRILYQAAVGRVAPYVEAATSEHVFSSRLSSDPRFFLLRSSERYGAWQSEILRRLKESGGVLVTTDLSGYFDVIDQTTLLKELEEMSGETFAIDLLRRQFRTWSVLLHRGIPQGPNASRLLGNAYMLPVDDYMLERGYSYLRYMDDVAIVVGNNAEAAKAVAAIEEVCHKRGLLLSSAKTEIQTLSEVGSEKGSALKKNVDYLMQSGGARAREALMAMFRSSVPPTGKIDISDAKFAVWRLAQRLDRGPLRRLLDRLADLGPIASVTAAYFRHFLAMPRTIEVVGEFLNDPERNTSEYLESWIFAAALEFPGKLPDRWIARARVTASDRNSAPHHRVVSINVLALSGRASDISYIRRLASHEHDPDVVRGATVALARVSKLDRMTEIAIVARHPDLLGTISFVKSRRRLPSLVYRGREIQVRR